MYMNCLALVGFWWLLATSSIAQNGRFTDRTAYTVINEYKRITGQRSVMHLTIEKNDIETVYTICAAETQEAATKRKIQRIFNYRSSYILLISNLTNGIQVPLAKQSQYREWLHQHLKPEIVETAYYPDPADSTQGIEESSWLIYEPSTLRMRYRNGKLYHKDLYRE